ncbi:MAG: hypothetical protein LT071_00405 [Nocardioides sp.]|nr:hypothetical protein [Nocardioides sp.]
MLAAVPTHEDQPAHQRAEFWAAIDAQRRAMSRAVGRRRRWWALVNLASLRPGSR